jgi:signal transduction histidine kinase
MSEEDVLEDRRASTPFTKELSLDAQKTISQIMGVTKIMKFKKEAKDQTQLIKQLTSQVRRLEHTVADLADVDALVHGSVQLSIRRSDLEALVTRVVEESAVSQDHDVRIEAQPVVAGVDPLRVEQMLAGMLRASGERTASGKLITVRLTNHEGGALLAVEDGEPSSDASMSPVVQRLAEVHGGWAKVEGREGGGSSFQVFLPDGARPDASPDAETPSSDTLQIVVNAPTGAAPESEPEPEPADTPWTQSEEALLVQELHRLSAED